MRIWKKINTGQNTVLYKIINKRYLIRVSKICPIAIVNLFDLLKRHVLHLFKFKPCLIFKKEGKFSACNQSA